MTRAATSALLGALTVAVGWTVWSTFGPRELSESALPDAATVAAAAPPATMPPAASPRALVQADNASGANARPAPPTPARPAPPLRDGLVMEHGMPTAVHALAADDADQALPPPAVALPPGIRPEDAAVNRAGMVTLTRSADTPSSVDASTANAPRPVVATRAP